MLSSISNALARASSSVASGFAVLPARASRMWLYSARVSATNLSAIVSLTKVPATPTARDASNTWMTGPEYTGSIRNAVWVFDVVAPPIISGIDMPAFSISSATVTISSSEGVMRPESPIMSASCSTAACNIVGQGTITPRSTISKPLHCSTTPTIFLPMSCTSPLTVAMMILPLPLAPATFSASIYGKR